jgi:hypothetical protein
VRHVRQKLRQLRYANVRQLTPNHAYLRLFTLRNLRLHVRTYAGMYATYDVLYTPRALLRGIAGTTSKQEQLHSNGPVIKHLLANICTLQARIILDNHSHG